MTTSAPESTIDLISELLVETFEIPSEEVRADARMLDLLTDSIMIVEMAMVLQERLGLKLAEEELRDGTLAEFAGVVDARRTAG
ncbi:phosphopantetheine-binding protein [Streptomyces sp. NBC_00435]|uniref:acyl carrier protein n=1 Tax=Streptomyces sp. NBC_00435 TaxID=2903649 RepID=UPI002E1CE5E0